ncbi:MAG: NAD(P)-dependent oxidoreductase [Planctomycetes bacterium]|nr:NAD(P)-dependent oxidoreductase [Planctomycetota bacterium]
METGKQSVGVIGLGLMGAAISERLIEFGYRVHVWNRSRDKADPLIARGATWSDNPLAECDRVLISLYSSDVVAQVIGQMQTGLRAGQIVIDTTTGEPQDCVALGQQLAQAGVSYLDSPISGSSEQTRRGEATVMVGGCSAAYAACNDLWPVLGKSVFYLGASGSASKMKLVSNLILGLNRAALAEGLSFAQSIGVDPAAALDVLRGSAAYSRVMDIKGQKMLTGDFRPQAKLSQHLKDVRLILNAAADAGLNLPLSMTHRGLLVQAEVLGCGELDNCSIITVYQDTSSTVREQSR